LSRPEIQASFWYHLDRPTTTTRDPNGAHGAPTGDIWEGDDCKRWKTVANPGDKSKSFFTRKHVFEVFFRLFLDGFQPYERVQYSVDALFLTIENLPPALRGKPENMILLALIPGTAMHMHSRRLCKAILRLMRAVHVHVQQDQALAVPTMMRRAALKTRARAHTLSMPTCFIAC